MTEKEAIEILENRTKYYIQAQDIVAFCMAIKALEEIQHYREIGTVEEIKDLLAVISEAEEDVDESGISVGFIKNIIQLAKYKKIGTVEECRAAVEKQKPKNPDYEGDGCDKDGKIIYDTWICPSCGERYEVDYDNYEYCPKCGQRIDMSEEDETD